MDINLYYDENNPENNVIENPLHLFFQEIELAIKTAPQQQFGFRYSIDLQKYVFNKYLSLNNIADEISLFISQNCESASLFQYEITAEVLELEGNSFLYILAKVYQGDDYLTQKFVLA